MFWLSKVFAPAVLVIGIAGSAVLVMAQQDGADGNQPPGGKGDRQPFGKGQPPFGKGFPGKGDDKKGDKKVEEKKIEDKKGDRRAEEKKGSPGQPGAKGPAPKPDAVVDAWVATLVGKITDPHDTVRDSARGALVAVGHAALPALQKLADGDDPAKAVAARKLIGAIHGRGPGGPAAGSSGRGFGGPGAPGSDRFGPGERGGAFGPGGRGGFGPGAPGGPGGFGPGGRGPGGPGGQPGMGPGGRGSGGPGAPGGGERRRPGREEEEREFEVAPQPRILAIH